MIFAFIKTNVPDGDIGEQKENIVAYAAEHGLTIDDYIMASTLRLKRKENQKDIILITSAVSLSCSLEDIKMMLRDYLPYYILVLIRENIVLDFDDNEVENFFKGVETALKLHSSIISMQTSKALKKARSKGQRLGNAKGCRLVSKMQRQKAEIVKKLRNKVSITQIAEELGLSRSGLHKFIKKENL